MEKRTVRKPLPLQGARIEDYALIGDCETAALVSRDGSIDWLCWPTFSSGACFAALLGTSDHGFWKIAPSGAITSVSRRYRPQTLIIDTTYVTAEGEVVVTDFMPPRGEHSHVMRIVRGIRGKVSMRMELAIRFDYGRSIPWVTKVGDQLRAIAGADMVVLTTKAPLHGQGMSTVSEFTVKPGQSISFTLTSASSLRDVPPIPAPEDALRETSLFWTDWMSRNTYRGRYQAMVDRSLITLKALTYRPSGGIVAAATSSLPEQIGGVRNWDYRFCWLRDTSFTLLVLMHAGFEEEAIAWRRWLLRAIAGSPEQVQTIYGICGERQLNEWTADWLPGYEHSKPVRFGNGAVGQFQLDVFGEVAAALARTPQAEDDIRVDATTLQSKLIDHLCHVWQEPDDGIWETRGGRKHFTHSKVMAWVALDRAIQHHERYDGGGDVKRWRKNRDLIHREVCEKGFDPKLNSFVQSYGSRELDASCLRIVLVGFLPPEDPRIRGTVDAIQQRLMRDGLVQRYDPETSSDGLPGGEGVFLACSFWLASNLHLIGRAEEARTLFERLAGLANDVGLLSEEYDPAAHRLLGNFPQALSHIALVHTAFTLSGMWRPQAPSERRT
ncbi:MAG: glycoside hydrolase family 15 protein [Acidobacteriaceae bacterium]